MKKILIFSFIISNSVLYAQDYNFTLGTWEGTMRNKKLTIVIQEVKGNVLKGYNVVVNNKRPIKGIIKIASIDLGGECGGEGEIYDAELKEPGDDKWDGVFNIKFLRCPMTEPGIDSGAPEMSTKMYGTWRANNGKLSGDFVMKKK